MNSRKMFAFLFSIILLMTTVVTAQKNDKLPPINYKEAKLKNGLRVILHQDKSTPIVAVNLWYHVGSKNEEPGKTGFAHLFEHMMFQGSKHYNKDYFGPLQEAGANINGSTNPDRTNYYEVVPSNFLELALWLESDRMGFLLDAMTIEKLDNQRSVVQNERRQRYDNQPYGTAFEKMSELIYPREHPYNWTTIGSLADLNAASMEDVKAFFRKYYAPNNASLVIAGDFEEKEAMALAEKYFGSIPTGTAEIERPNPPMPRINGTIRYQMEDSVQLPRLYLAWHTSEAYSKDEPALDILSRILTAGRGSRLQKNLVYDKQISQDVSAFNYARELSGLFQISSTAKPGQTTDQIEKEIWAEIERIKKEAPTADEMTRALNGYESSSIFGMQTILGKADQLNSYATFLGKPDYFQADLDRYRAVTAADVKRVANEYLNDNHLAMTIVPRPKDRKAPSVRTGKDSAEDKDEMKKSEKMDDSMKKSDAEMENKSQEDWRKNQPKGGATPKFNLPAIQKAKLKNGLDVWLVQQDELPIVSMNMVFKTGSDYDPLNKAGLNSVTASLLNEGTKNRTAVEIANELQSIGAGIGTSNNNDSSSVRLQTLTKHFDKALDIFADVIQNPTFPTDEIETYRRRVLVSLLQRKDNPNAIAELVYNKILYTDKHPYGISPNEASIKAITRDDVVNNHESFYRPNNATLIVVGDTDMKTLTAKLESKFSNWKEGSIKPITLPEAATADKATIYLVDKPGAAQSIINIGQIGVPRNSADYFPLLVMNQILGGQFSARVNMNLREDKGYTYGARSGFAFRRNAGPFIASAGVQTAVTKESVVEFLKELNGIRGAIPVTQSELEYNKQSLVRSFPRGFETAGQIGGRLDDLVVYDLPETYFNDYIKNIEKVTLADVNRVANKYLTPDKMAIVVVGDKSVIDSKLREIENLGQSIVYLDSEGNPVK